jgi:hypothetical protein
MLKLARSVLVDHFFDTLLVGASLYFLNFTGCVDYSGFIEIARWLS